MAASRGQRRSAARSTVALLLPVQHDWLTGPGHPACAPGNWTAPGILEARIPGRMQSHASTAEVPR
jgi:hypothetical protein